MLKPPPHTRTHTTTATCTPHTTRQHTEQKNLGVIIHDGDHGECTGVEGVAPPTIHHDVCAHER
jgi:hypothetical protein